MLRRIALAALVALAVAVPAAQAGGRKPVSDPPCTVSGNVVSATGLPTDQVINFMVTTSAGTTGWVLGFTPDGTWWVDVPAAEGSPTYQFVSRTYGSDGSKYSVFAACSG